MNEQTWIEQSGKVIKKAKVLLMRVKMGKCLLQCHSYGLKLMYQDLLDIAPTPAWAKNLEKETAPLWEMMKNTTGGPRE